jgi:nicotinamidase/pyrazinamidase
MSVLRSCSINPATDAFLAVDVAKTFMPGGGLPIAGGDLIVPAAIEVAQAFPVGNRYACLDKHPFGHASLASSYRCGNPYQLLKMSDLANFTSKRMLAQQAKFNLHQLTDYLELVKQQVLWPDHGIIGTAESEMHPDLAAIDFRLVLQKGLGPVCDSYSAFKDNIGWPTGLADEMRQNGVKRLFLVGLAFDYCVGFSALDAVGAGFQVSVIMAGTRSVASDSAAAMEKRLRDAGVHLL